MTVGALLDTMQWDPDQYLRFERPISLSLSESLSMEISKATSAIAITRMALPREVVEVDVASGDDQTDAAIGEVCGVLENRGERHRA